MDDRDHVISVVLSTEDFKAFRELQPEPVIWLREQIRQTIAAAREQTTAKQTTAA